MALPSAEPSRSRWPSPFQSRSMVGNEAARAERLEVERDREGALDPGLLLEVAAFTGPADLGAHVDRALHEDLRDLQQPDRHEHAHPLGTRIAVDVDELVGGDPAAPLEDLVGVGQVEAAVAIAVDARAVDRALQAATRVRHQQVGTSVAVEVAHVAAHRARIAHLVLERHQPQREILVGSGREGAVGDAGGRCGARGGWSRRCRHVRRRRCRRRAASARRSRARLRSRRSSVPSAAAPGSWRDRRCASAPSASPFAPSSHASPSPGTSRRPLPSSGRARRRRSRPRSSGRTATVGGVATASVRQLGVRSASDSTITPSRTSSSSSSPGASSTSARS